MFFIRLFFICCFVFLAQMLEGQTNSPVQAPEKKAPGPEIVATPAETPITFNSVYVEGPYIAVTFDDGPHLTLTPKLLDLLAANRIKATFFIIGQNATEYPQIVKRAAREGHEIASHSWSHPNLSKMSDEAVRRELEKTDEVIKSLTGTRPRLMRPPYGAITQRQKRWIHEAFGYRIIMWDVDPLDWKRPGASVVCQRIVNGARPGSIVLAHDIHPGTLSAMPATLEQLREKGFKFVTVSELLAMARPAPPKPVATPLPVVRAPAAPGSGEPLPPAESTP